MSYSDMVIDHFINPRNAGYIPDPDGTGVVGDPSCGDFLRIYINVENNCISDIKFEIFGCPAAIATSSILTELAKGKDIDEALKITDLDVVKALGGLPDPKVHCSNLGSGALHQAIQNYKSRMREEKQKKTE